MTIVPYLTFPGNGEEALTLYKSVLGGEVTMMRYSDMPPNDDMPVSDEWKDKVMHAQITFPSGQSIYMSDTFEGAPLTAGDNMAVHLDLDSEQELRRIFDGLSDGATVTMPVETQFWGAVYASLIDRFGVNWGLHYTIPAE